MFEFNLPALPWFRPLIASPPPSFVSVKKLRQDVKDLVSEYNRTEEDLKAIQSVGMLIGDVLKQMDDERFIVKASSGPRYVVGCRTKLDKAKLKQGTRVALDMTTLTIMRPMPREVDPTVFNMLHEEEKTTDFSEIGGLNDQIRELREVIELPLTNPELFIRVGIKAPKVRINLPHLVTPVYSGLTHTLPSTFLLYRAFCCTGPQEQARLC